MARSKLYTIWWDMKRRCYDPRRKEYLRYGGRGVKVSKEWLIFSNFQKDMLPDYKKGLTLERINNNGDYSKENCRWATYREQNNNKRINRLFSFNGVSKTLNEWARISGIKASTLRQRFYVYHWSIDRLFEGRMN